MGLKFSCSSYVVFNITQTLIHIHKHSLLHWFILDEVLHSCSFFGSIFRCSLQNVVFLYLILVILTVLIL
jgi:hypothetical protein